MAAANPAQAVRDAEEKYRMATLAPPLPDTFTPQEQLRHRVEIATRIIEAMHKASSLLSPMADYAYQSACSTVAIYLTDSVKVEK